MTAIIDNLRQQETSHLYLSQSYNSQSITLFNDCYFNFASEVESCFFFFFLIVKLILQLGLNYHRSPEPKHLIS